MMNEYKVENWACPVNGTPWKLDINGIGEQDQAIEEALNDLAQDGWELHSLFTRVHEYNGEVTTSISAVLFREVK